MPLDGRLEVTLEGVDRPSPFRNLGSGGIPPETAEADRIVEMVRRMTDSGRLDLFAQPKPKRRRREPIVSASVN